MPVPPTTINIAVSIQLQYNYYTRLTTAQSSTRPPAVTLKAMRTQVRRSTALSVLMQRVEKLLKFIPCKHKSVDNIIIIMI